MHFLSFDPHMHMKLLCVIYFMFQFDMAGMEEQYVWEYENEEPGAGKPKFRGRAVYGTVSS
jgi:hypothetical protein